MPRDVLDEYVVALGLPAVVVTAAEARNQVRIALAAGADARGNAVEPLTALAFVDEAAAAIGLPLETDDRLRVRAAAILDRVDRELERARRTGGLKRLNSSYRERRLAATAAGRKSPSYAAFMADYRMGLVRVAAAGGR